MSDADKLKAEIEAKQKELAEVVTHPSMMYIIPENLKKFNR